MCYTSTLFALLLLTAAAHMHVRSRMCFFWKTLNQEGIVHRKETNWFTRFQCNSIEFHPWISVRCCITALDVIHSARKYKESKSSIGNYTKLGYQTSNVYECIHPWVSVSNRGNTTRCQIKVLNAIYSTRRHEVLPDDALLQTWIL